MRADLDRDAGVPRQHVQVVETGLVRYPLDFAQLLVDLGLDGFEVAERVGGILRLHREFADAMQAAIHLAQRALDGLRQRDTVVGVARRLALAADLRSEVVGDGFAGGVIRRVIDALAG